MASDTPRHFLLVYKGEHPTPQREIGIFGAGAVLAAREREGINVVSLIQSEVLAGHSKNIRTFFPHLAGVIIYRRKETCEEMVKIFDPLKIPVLNYGSSNYVASCGTPHYISIFEDEVVRRAGEYLWNQGHRAIGLYQAKGWAHIERAKLWKQWMTARGQKVDKDMHLEHTPFVAMDPKAAKVRLKKLVNKVTAIIVTDDAFMPEFHRSLIGLGLKVPSQMSLVGINNTVLNQKSILPATSIELSPFRHGSLCFDTLYQLITGRIDRAVESAPVEIIERDSTRRPRKKMKVV